MKVYNKFVHSIKEPSNKSDIWFDGSYWRMYTGGQWTPFTISTKVAKKVEEYANNLKLFNIVDVLPEKGVEDIIYLLIDSSGENTTLIQYTYINNSWEELGSFTINVSLEDYIKKEEIPFENGDAENSAVLKGGNNQVISEGGVALGKDNVVGLKGWYYKAISFNSSNGEIHLYLSKTQQVPKAVSSASQVEQEKDIAFPLSVGTIVSLVNDVKYDNKFKIERIDELSTYGRIKLSRADGDKTLYFRGIKVETDLSPEDYSIYCLSEPTTGIVDLGQSSFVTGDNNKAINGKSVSFGINNTSWGKCAFTEGMSNEAGYDAHAEGKGNKAIGNHSHAEGQNNEAWKTSSHAEGSTNITYGPASHIEGKNNYIGEEDTTVVVEDTTTKGYAAHAEGQANVVLGNSAHAEGIKNKVYDNGGHAEGRDNVVKGIYAHAEGRGNITNNEYEHASGKYNVSTPKTADNTTADATQFSIGIGTSDTKRKNAFEVKQNGDIYVEGVESRIQEKLNTVDTLDTQLTELSEIINNLPKDDEFDKDGKYPQLTSGFASNLVGRGESTESEFSFRASGGKSIEDGAARISELRGNGVVWNQLVRLKDNVSGVGGITVVVNADGSFSVTGTNTSGSDVRITITENFANISGHKYCVTGYPSGGSLETYYLLEGYSTKKFYNGYVGTLSSTSNTMSRFAIVIKAGYSISGTLVFKPKITDLTLMFGAGNEPTTIEEFNARKPIGVDEYAYNEGTLIPFNADAIKSVGFNAWDGAMEEGYVSDTNGTTPKVPNSLCTNFVRVLPNNDYFIRTDATSGRFGAWYDANKNYIAGIAGAGIKTSPANAAYMRMTIVYNGNGNPDTFCINLSHTGYRNGEYQPYEDFVRAIDPRIKEAFPDGMKPWDKVYNKNGKGYIVKGTGVVDMGTLNWKYETITSGDNYYVHISDIKRPNAGKISARYPMGFSNSRNVMFNTSANLNISADGFNQDASAFKAAMQGVMLYYELADEYKEVIEYDEPFNLDYEVWDFGTEQIIASEPCAPISADIIYQFNAVDTIRNNQIEIEQLKTMIATMQAQMASLINK